MEKTFYFSNILSAEEKRDLIKNNITMNDIESSIVKSLIDNSYKTFIKSESIFFIKNKNYRVTFKYRIDSQTIQIRSIIFYD